MFKDMVLPVCLLLGARQVWSHCHCCIFLHPWLWQAWISAQGSYKQNYLPAPSPNGSPALCHLPEVLGEALCPRPGCGRTGWGVKCQQGLGQWGGVSLLFLPFSEASAQGLWPQLLCCLLLWAKILSFKSWAVKTGDGSGVWGALRPLCQHLPGGHLRFWSHDK